MRLNRDAIDSSPFRQFEQWFQAATDAGINEPNAMCLSTVSREGKPSSRMVLLKIWDEQGFVFFTNFGSRKAAEIAGNRQVALLFYWEPMQRQVRIEGTASKISIAESATYFATRPRGSQLGAWCSAQSTTISSRSILESKLAEIQQKFLNQQVPLPSFWGGYRVTPDRFEFWQQGADRLHDRIEYANSPQIGWTTQQLAP